MFRMNICRFIFSIIFSSLFLLSNPFVVLANEYDHPLYEKDAPTFTLNGYNSLKPNKTNWSLKDYHGKWIVLYFYPKDLTSGCTIEAKGFQRLSSQFRSLNASIIGVSSDSNFSHKSFCSKQKLDFTLLSDTNGEISKEYGSWNHTFSNRNTFLINPKGKIVFLWTSVKPTTHPKEVLVKLTEIINS